MMVARALEAVGGMRGEWFSEMWRRERLPGLIMVSRGKMATFRFGYGEL